MLRGKGLIHFLSLRLNSMPDIGAISSLALFLRRPTRWRLVQWLTRDTSNSVSPSWSALIYSLEHQQYPENVKECKNYAVMLA